MIIGIEKAVDELKRDLGRPVTAVVDDMIVELRFERKVEPRSFEGQRTAAEVFRDIGPWAGESQEALEALLNESRRQGGVKEPPAF